VFNLKKADRFEVAISGLTLVIIILLIAGPGLKKSGPIDPADLDTYLPYQLVPVPYPVKKEYSTDSRLGFSSALVNYDGGETSDHVIFTSPGISGLKLENGEFVIDNWQYNLDSRFAWANKSAAVFGGMDINGSGQEEVLISCRTENGSEHVIEAYSPGKGSCIGRIELPAGEDRRKDGVWDGFYKPLGVFKYKTEGGSIQRALLVSCSVNYDALGRGIFALDLSEGKILWSFPMGPPPMWPEIKTADLDGDGLEEILVPTTAPGNLGGLKVNGISDDKLWLFVLNGDGQLRWSTCFGKGPGAVYCDVFDWDNDGKKEVVTVVGKNLHSNSAISIWNGETGEQTSELETKIRVSNVSCWRETNENPATVVTTNIFGGVYELNLQKGKKQILQQTISGKSITNFCSGDFLPDPGKEIFLVVDKKYILIIGPGPTILAKTTYPGGKQVGLVDFWHFEKNKAYILSAAGSFLLTPSTLSQRTDPRPFAQTTGLFVLSTGLLFVRRRRQSFYRRSLDIEDPDVLRELRLRLLSDLELSDHGSMGLLKSVRRLVWNLESRCAGLGESEEMNKRMMSGWKDFENYVLPHVRDILNLAEKVNIEPLSVKRTKESLETIEQTVGSLAETQFSPEAVIKELRVLQEASNEAETGLQKIRNTVEDLFQSNLNEVWDLVLRSRQEDLKAAGVVVQREPEEMAMLCRIDSNQLEFMLDNLVGNAIRAMAESVNPMLTVTTSKADGFILCDVKDCGWGIEPEDWDRIMETPNSTREGGGVGLFETSRLLRLYGGTISVRESQPHIGTTIRIIVPESRQAKPRPSC